jgi:hypothetical protein
MEQRISLITLGVADLVRSRRFYIDGLGWRESTAGNPHIAFIDAGGVILALYGREALADDMKVPAAGSGFSGFSLAHNVRTRAEVDQVIAQAQAAGATVLKPAHEAFWGGYSGYFADPDGHPWEVAHNPHFPIDETGRVLLPG